MNRRKEATDYTNLRPLTITITCDVCGLQWRPRLLSNTFDDICLCGLQDVKDYLEVIADA